MKEIVLVGQKTWDNGMQQSWQLHGSLGSFIESGPNNSFPLRPEAVSAIVHHTGLAPEVVTLYIAKPLAQREQPPSNPVVLSVEQASCSPKYPGIAFVTADVAMFPGEVVNRLAEPVTFSVFVDNSGQSWSDRVRRMPKPGAGW